MAYPTLEKLFYADSSSDRYASHRARAQQRLTNEATFRTGIHLEHGELFLAVPRELSIETEQVLRRERRVSALWKGLPPIALGAYIRALILDEVVYSNEMEGVHSTRRQIEIALEHAQNIAHAPKAHEDHAPFMEFANLYLNLTQNQPSPESLEDIRAIYDSVVADAIDPGDLPEETLFRSGPVVIENERGKTVHVGVTPETAIEHMMRQWLQLSHREDMPELYSAMLCHFLFGYIHPFYDGNGRTGRYLLALQLSRPLSQPTALSLSRVIAENKAAYYKAFDITERRLNRAEGTHFVLTMLDLVGQAQAELIADLESKRASIERVRERVAELEQTLSARECDVLFYAAQMHLFDAFQEVRSDRLQDYLQASAPTVRKYLGSLCDAGYLVRVSARPPIHKLTDQGIQALGLPGGSSSK